MELETLKKNFEIAKNEFDKLSNEKKALLIYK